MFLERRTLCSFIETVLPCSHVACDIGDVVPWVTVERLLEAILIKEVPNETNRSSKDKETI